MDTSAMNLGIIDIGIGNAKSISNVLSRENIAFQLIQDPSDLSGLHKIILPGVGSFDANMELLNKFGFTESLKEANKKGISILGICLGAQLLLSKSEEGTLPGLGFINGMSLEFSGLNNFKVPHMGWNSVHKEIDSGILNGIDPGERFYFAHSYYIIPEDISSTIASTGYGITFSSVIEKNNCYGVQFHPEKSHKQGIKILTNFVELNV